MLIYNDFKTKMAEIVGAGLMFERLALLYERFCTESDGTDLQAVIGGALLYFILSADVIPDYVWPIGYLDDAIAGNLAMRQLAVL